MCECALGPLLEHIRQAHVDHRVRLRRRLDRLRALHGPERDQQLHLDGCADVRVGLARGGIRVFQRVSGGSERHWIGAGQRWLRLRLGMALDFAVDPSERVHVTDGRSAGLGDVWPMWSNGALR
jgi:hypothetical protein